MNIDAAIQAGSERATFDFDAIVRAGAELLAQDEQHEGHDRRGVAHGPDWPAAPPPAPVICASEKRHTALESLTRLLEADAVPSTQLEGEVPADLLARLHEAMAWTGVTLTLEQLDEGRLGQYNAMDRRIVVAGHLDPVQQARVLAHEVGHVYDRGHRGPDAKPDREVVADSVAYILCRRYGLDIGRYAVVYIKYWLDRGAAKPAELSDRIDRIYQEILDADTGPVYFGRGSVDDPDYDPEEDD